MDNDDLVVLQKFSSLHEAELAVSSLEAAELDAILRDSSFGGFRPESGITGGGVTVLVRRDQLSAAREVLAHPALHDASDVSVTCANCGRVLNGTICGACESQEDDRDTFLTPQNTRANIGKLKVVVIGGFLLVMILPTIIDRLSRIDEKTVLTVLAIVAGAVLVVVLLKVFVTSSEERL